MKICACIAEYNPFHLGHLKHINYIKNELGAEKVVVIMSGNFTQRGEPAVLNKFKRAELAVKYGADLVIELPTVFATANAEIFAKGAINVLNSLGKVDGICFGVESGSRQDYLTLAGALNSESKEFKRILKENLDKGVSLAKAKCDAVKTTYGEFDESLLSSPNNILGVEYTRAILSLNSNMEIHPMIRLEDHNDEELKKGITSAKSIRRYIKAGLKKKVKKNLPPLTYKALKDYPYEFDKIIMSKVILSSREEMSKIPDCTEGLENRIKALSKDNLDVENLIDKVSSKRYTKARIRRILIANLLGITKDFCDDCLKSSLYAKVLAVNGKSKDIISTLSQNSTIPLLTRKSDLSLLKKTALKCYELDVLANDLYNLVLDEKNNENYMVIV